MIQETEWYHSRPKCVQKRINTYPPDQMYRMRSTGYIVPIHAYNVDGKKCNTCIVKLLKVNNPRLKYEYNISVPFEDLVMRRDDMARYGTKGKINDSRN